MAFGDFTVDRNSPKWVLGADGYLKEYIADEPAIEFNADGSYKGVLVEPQSVNDCLQSEDINTTWTTNPNAAPTQSTETTPDGDSTNKYIKLVDDGGGGTGGIFVSQSIIVLADTTYTFSVFLKADQLSFARLEAVGYAAISGHQYFGLSGSGSLGTASNLDDSKIEAYPNNWYRCSITYKQGVGDTDVALRIWVANSISNVSNLPLDGTSSIFAWGAQLEASPIATSYIPTTTGSVTRVKDDIYLTSASSLIGQTEGTLYCEFIFNREGDVFVIANASNGTTDYVGIFRSTSDLLFRIRYNSTNNINFTTPHTIGQRYKVAIAYKSGDTAVFVNGSQVSTTSTTAFSFSTTLSYLEFLNRVFYISPDAGGQYYRAVALYTSRLTDTECQDLTTL